MNKNLKYILPVGILASANLAMADAAADAQALVTTAETVFGLVAALSVTMIGFYLVVRIVKGIKK